jgi:hypothetical protein
VKRKVKSCVEEKKRLEKKKKRRKTRGEVPIMYSRVQRIHQICETEAAIATHSESKTKVEFKDK